MIEFILILVPFLLLVFAVTYLYNELQAVKDKIEDLKEEMDKFKVLAKDKRGRKIERRN